MYPRHQNNCNTLTHHFSYKEHHKNLKNIIREGFVFCFTVVLVLSNNREKVLSNKNYRILISKALIYVVKTIVNGQKSF